MRIIFISLIIILSFNINSIHAQCFGSPGNPVAGTANAGILKKNLLRINLYTRYSYSDKYYNSYKKTDFKLYDNAYYNYIGNTIAYGITDKLTIESELGFFVNKTINYYKDLPYTLPEYKVKGSGFDHVVLSLKRAILKDNFPLKWAMSGGVKLPLRLNPQTHNNTVLPIDVQPSKMALGLVFQSYLLSENSFKGLRYFLINRYEYNFTNSQNYKWGQTIYSSFYISKRLHFKKEFIRESLTGLMQLRSEYRTFNYNYNLFDPKVNASGNSLLFLTPQLNYSYNELLNLSILVDIPVFQYYNKTQLSTNFGITLNITKDF